VTHSSASSNLFAPIGFCVAAAGVESARSLNRELRHTTTASMKPGEIKLKAVFEPAVEGGLGCVRPVRGSSRRDAQNSGRDAARSSSRFFPKAKAWTTPGPRQPFRFTDVRVLARALHNAGTNAAEVAVVVVVRSLLLERHQHIRSIQTAGRTIAAPSHLGIRQ
jgi:hypothetical protein